MVALSFLYSQPVPFQLNFISRALVLHNNLTIICKTLALLWRFDSKIAFLLSIENGHHDWISPDDIIRVRFEPQEAGVVLNYKWRLEFGIEEVQVGAWGSIYR